MADDVTRNIINSLSEAIGACLAQNLETWAARTARQMTHLTDSLPITPVSENLSSDEGMSVVRLVAAAIERGESVYAGRWQLESVMFREGRLLGFIRDAGVSLIVDQAGWTGRFTYGQSAYDLGVCLGVDITERNIWSADRNGKSALLYQPCQFCRK